MSLETLTQQLVPFVGAGQQVTIYRWISENNMPAHRVERLWKFKEIEIDQWIKDGGSADSSKNSD